MKRKRESWLPREIARRCVFCGGQPSNRNREHVLPHWLLELTGKPSRTVPVAFNWATGEPIVHSWNTFTAPACTSCNDAFSNLEGAAKVPILRLLAGEPLTGELVDLLLRWLDKVRVGLWLISNVVGGGPLSVTPTFAIRDRIDANDRAVVVVRTSGPSQGLTVIGPSMPIFRFMPSCMGLVINGVALINLSAAGLLGANSGFPWLDVQRIVGNGQLEVVVRAPTEKVTSPALDLEPLHTFVTTDASQPTFAQWAVAPTWGRIDHLLTEWCNRRLLKPGLSHPLLCRGGNADYVQMADAVEPIGATIRIPEAITRVVLESQVALARRHSFSGPLFTAAVEFSERALRAYESDRREA